ncbi:prolyl-tRNA synthetase associated domain-containing protein [Limosilactobacillus sp.]|jgi:Ala-tRNA(Pro) deacylase|uniref:prolyl-tRNA synthetase associated domain-containing protein n=1 Tax=Limosilactobacillus sp. TaxID=2773925 RepID=UPI0025C404BF|nr:prolyl-tRNA synthetase associated domain-containing protein [Limosilactobacillus sp.]MCH3921635.1 prolyl-tRNA synthetase associated domain-containing protein [Limosilactobacillus sp.]MCH3928406.1 prolyl-tRNA synthetase associated domain-containing protein [Limosilactobacillus sp.]
MAKGTYQQVKDALKKLGIDDYYVVDHPAAHTTEEADEYIAGHEGVRTKTMFLKGKKKKYYMVIMDDKKRMDFHEFQDLTGAKRVSMAQPAALEEQLGLEPGVVSPFGLLNNEDHNVTVYIDKDIVDEPIQTFHPNENTHTLFIKTPDLMKFLKAIDFEPEIIDL